MTLKYDRAALARMVGRVAQAARSHDALNAALAKESVRLAREGFDTSAAPSGEAWEETKSGNPPLMGTGALRNSFVVFEASRRGFRIGSTIPWADAHQSGRTYAPKFNKRTKKMSPGGKLPARPMLPTSATAPDWDAALMVVGRRFTSRLLGK